jgi:hypothetical protein
MKLKLTNQQLILIRFRLDKVKEKQKELREKQSRESIDPWELVALSNEEYMLDDLLETEVIDLNSIH